MKGRKRKKYVPNGQIAAVRAATSAHREQKARGRAERGESKALLAEMRFEVRSQRAQIRAMFEKALEL